MPKDLCMVTEHSLHEITAAEKPELSNHDDSVAVADLIRGSIQPSLENICFMDMRSTDILQPSDSQ